MDNSELHIVMVGHVDHGKSTVIGRLLYDTKSLPEGTIDKVKQIAKETGKPFEYAYLLDAFEEEQKQGITIDTTQLKFHTDSREYVIIDAPGHKEFLKNMISGASDAEVAFLIVDAARGVEEQTKRHAYILRLLGIRQIYVLINKMDLVDYEQTRFTAVKAEVSAFLATLQLQAAGFIPVSAYYGENLLQRSAKMPWYTGKSFITTLDSIQAKPTPVDQPLRLPIQDVFKFDDRRIIAGRIEAGALQVDDKIKLYPSGRETVVTEFANWAPGMRKLTPKSVNRLAFSYKMNFSISVAKLSHAVATHSSQQSLM
ncbi:GTP-binding protein [Loigolactobacillus jiayinensis]|uniref:GTP-binding protein n=1 Tax=Loigolactobacillus jiayinensis TaxID=2486016 RepID=A0ABW1RB34_9LACO|nr:GTP-binding protein [Loigolactobacillus jiayinensis]